MARWWRRIIKREDSAGTWPQLRMSRTLECDQEAHDDCGHALGIFGAAEGQVTLCSCPCHEPCPLGQQQSAGHPDFMLTCTCPANMTIRRNQERAGLTPAEAVRLIQEHRQRRTPLSDLSDEQRQELSKRGLVRTHQAAAAQAAGQPPSDDVTFSLPPQEMMDFVVLQLALRYSDAEAARLLGLTDAQVTVAKKAGLHHIAARAKRERAQARHRDRAAAGNRRNPGQRP